MFSKRIPLEATTIEVLHFDIRECDASIPMADGAKIAPLSASRRFAGAVIALGLLAVSLVGCGDDDSPSEASTETTAAPDTTSTTAAPDTTSTTAAPTATSATPLEAPPPTDVTETYSVPDFGYSISYPSGWFVETRGPITQIASSEEALFLFPGSEVPTEFVVICLDHLSVAPSKAPDSLLTIQQPKI